jgi:hypothetical protein
LQKSTTLNRKFVKRPSPVAQKSTKQPSGVQRAVAAPKIITNSQKDAEALKRRQAIADQMNKDKLAAMKRGHVASAKTQQKADVAARPKKQLADTPDVPASVHPRVAAVTAQQRAQRSQPRQLTARELKDRAIKQALERVATMGNDQADAVEEQMIGAITKKRRFWQSKKLMAAICMSAVSLALLGYLIHLNLPDLSVRVAAMQTGVNGSYPNYVPPGYKLDGLVTGREGKIVIDFIKDYQGFTITQEKSSWDSATLLSNLVRPKWGSNYTIAREQGLTIYISGSNAVWTSGGILYQITATGDNLTHQQIHDIATSL